MKGWYACMGTLGERSGLNQRASEASEQIFLEFKLPTRFEIVDIFSDLKWCLNFTLTNRLNSRVIFSTDFRANSRFLNYPEQLPSRKGFKLRSKYGIIVLFCSEIIFSTYFRANSRFFGGHYRFSFFKKYYPV